MSLKEIRERNFKAKMRQKNWKITDIEIERGNPSGEKSGISPILRIEEKESRKKLGKEQT